MLTVRFSQNCSSRAAGQELRRRRAILSRHHHVAPPSTVQRYDSSGPHHLYLLSQTSRRLSLCLSHRQSYALFHPFDPAACFPDLVAHASIPSFRGDQGNGFAEASASASRYHRSPYVASSAALRLPLTPRTPTDLPLPFATREAAVSGLEAAVEERGLGRYLGVYESRKGLAIFLSLPGYPSHAVVRCLKLERAKGMRELVDLLVERGIVVIGSETVG